MTTDFRAMCAELVDLLDCFSSTFNIPIETSVVARARALLDQQEPQPPASGEVAAFGLADRQRDAVKAAVADAIGGGAYDCSRVWEAWNVGTMGPDDFSLVAEDDDRVAEIADAAIAAAHPTPQPPADGEVAELVRWGVDHGAQPGRPLLYPMEDGYWTPWHIAADLLQRQHPQPVAHVDVGIEWRPCVKLPITVHVRDQRPGETHSSTREGITPLRSNDLIMRGVQGEEYPIGRELFEQTYKLIPANALPTPSPMPSSGVL